MTLDVKKRPESNLADTYGSNDEFGNINYAVEVFIFAFLMLFVAIEEVDWLVFSANLKNQDSIEYESSWNLNKIFSFKLL